MSTAIDYKSSPQGPKLGLSIAVEDLTRAWMRYTRQDKLVCRPADVPSYQAFAQMAQNLGLDAAARCVAFDPLAPGMNPVVTTLFVPDPDLGAAAWLRAQSPSPSYALCGLVHSLSGEQVSRVVADLCVAPTNEADALICPSRAIRDSVLKLWDIQADYLNHRFGGSFTCPVQTPIIPIGIDTGKFAALSAADKRATQREALKLDEDEVMILFVGRLNFATKAHPYPLLQAASMAARQTKKKIRLVLYGYFLPQAEMEPRFRKLVQEFAPQMNCEIVTNDDPRFPDGLWAAADIFASLVDNVQESFGLTPIEAMACGLPVVVSDWDGYRDGVRNGLDGFLIPTLAPPPEAASEIALRYFQNRNYGLYLAGTAQSTAVDIEAAARAFAFLADSKAKREEMGESGRARARAVYDWSVIIPAYEALWQRQGEEASRQTARSTPAGWQAVAPAFPNPGTVFESFSSRTLGPDDTIQIRAPVEEIALLAQHDMNLMQPDLLLPIPLVQELAEAIRANGAIKIRDILAIAPASEHPRLLRTVGWLAKYGLCARVE